MLVLMTVRANSFSISVPTCKIKLINNTQSKKENLSKFIRTDAWTVGIQNLR